MCMLRHRAQADSRQPDTRLVDAVGPQCSRGALPHLQDGTHTLFCAHVSIALCFDVAAIRRLYTHLEGRGVP